jgi:hypothetical protein
MILENEQWRIVAYTDGVQVKVNALRELQSTSGEAAINGLTDSSELVPAALNARIVAVHG